MQMQAESQTANLLHWPGFLLDMNSCFDVLLPMAGLLVVLIDHS